MSLRLDKGILLLEGGKFLYVTPGGPSNESMRGIASAGCDLDWTLHHTINMESIPVGSAAVPVTVDDSCYIYKGRMVAGSVGIRVTISWDILDSRELSGFITGPNSNWISQYTEPETEPECGLDSLQPVSGWQMYKVIEDPETGMTEAEQVRTKGSGGGNLDVHED